MLINSPELFGTPKFLIMDPVHGGIPFFEHEKHIIDHPLFLRLRHIKQTDILHYVFPGATHTRFEHSIGSMHIASRIFKNIVKGYILHRSENEDLKNVSLKEDVISGFNYVYGCLRIAALLHDVGHLPFSHQFEESEVGNNIFSDKTIIKQLSNDGITLRKNENKVKHEHLSLMYAKILIKDVKKEFDFQYQIDDITSIMEDGKHKPSKKLKKYLEIILDSISPEFFAEIKDKREEVLVKLINFLKSLISGEIDADKMDYLLRDSHFSGSQYGLYNIDHLIQNITLGWSPRTLWIGVAIKEKGIGAFEDFVYSRFRMYLQIYNHKTVINFKVLLKHAISEVFGKNESEVKEHILNKDKFINFTDDFVWHRFRQYSKNHNSASYKLLNRKKLEYIESLNPLIDRDKIISERKKEIECEKKCEIIQSEASSKFSKITPNFEKIRKLKKNRNDGKFELTLIYTDFFDKFSNVAVYHYFKKPSFF